MAGLEKGEDIEDVGTSVLFSGGTMMSLNILGTEIWKLCDGRTLDEIVRALVEIFDVQPEVLREDAAGFISELNVKSPGKILSQEMAGAGLQCFAILHQGFNGICIECTCKSLIFSHFIFLDHKSLSVFV